MNVAIGGTLGGDEYVPGGSFNYEMYVDYVGLPNTTSADNGAKPQTNQ